MSDETASVKTRDNLSADLARVSAATAWLHVEAPAAGAGACGIEPNWGFAPRRASPVRPAPWLGGPTPTSLRAALKMDVY